MIATVTTVELIELHGRAREFGALRIRPEQLGSVATVFESYADALFPPRDGQGQPLVPWLRGVLVDGRPGGFVMTTEPTPTQPDPWVWRLLVDRDLQGRGVGRAVMEQVIARYRAMGATDLYVSFVPGEYSPAGFYLGLGFEMTGEEEDGELVARLRLQPSEEASTPAP
jgi:diamine N-acetyltransferase